MCTKIDEEPFLILRGVFPNPQGALHQKKYAASSPLLDHSAPQPVQEPPKLCFSGTTQPLCWSRSLPNSAFRDHLAPLPVQKPPKHCPRKRLTFPLPVLITSDFPHLTWWFFTRSVDVSA